jgi:uncharacterized protein (DUF1499 family)
VRVPRGVRFADYPHAEEAEEKGSAMGLLAWLTRNWADTDEPGNPGPVPPELPLPPPEALARVEAAVRGLPRWQVEGVDREGGVVRATRRTRLWRFVDDVTVRLEATAGGTRVHARSQSRVGKGDFGQNRRNLRELFRALQGSGSQSNADDADAADRRGFASD